AHIDEDKISRAWTKFQFHRPKFVFQISATGIHYAFTFPQMFVISESGQRTGLGNAIYIEGLPGFLKHFDQLRWRDSIAHAQTGQPMNFRKRAQNDNIPAIAHMTKSIGWIVQKFK